MTVVEPGIILASACTAALAVLLLRASGLRPPRRLAGRLRPYTRGVRARLGAPPDVAEDLSMPAGQSVVLRVLGAPFMTLMRRLGAVGRQAGAEPDAALQLRLDKAGLDLTPADYRARQLRGALVWPVVIGALGFVVTGSLALSLACAGIGLLLGISRESARVDRLVRRRALRVRMELYPILLRLGFHLRTNGRVLGAVEDTVRRGEGVVTEELRRVLAWVHGGSSVEEAFRRAAEHAPEPFAARAWRMIAVGERRGGHLADSLMSLAADVRRALRRELQEQATRRRFWMMTVTVVFMSPVLVLMVAAPMGFLVLGAR